MQNYSNSSIFVNNQMLSHKLKLYTDIANLKTDLRAENVTSHYSLGSDRETLQFTAVIKTSSIRCAVTL